MFYPFSIPVEKVSIPPVALHLSVRAVLHYLPAQGVYLHAYPARGSTVLDVYDRTHRLARHRLSSSWANLDDVGFSYLHGPTRKGIVLEHWTGNSMAVIVFPDWRQEPVSDSFEKSEFSTTGWSEVSVDQDPESGYARIDEAHYSPGEEGENGRETDVYHVFFTWNPKVRTFLKERD